MRPKLRLIGTGGTISAVARTPTDYWDYAMSGQRLSAEALLATFPQLSESFDITCSNFKPVSSTEVDQKFWKDLLAELASIGSAATGVVVTHGTGTLEETAFAIDLFSNFELPIVFTGAQRPHNTLSSDVARNLWGAFRVAAHEQARHRGVLVVMDGQVHSASEVSKTANFSLGAFQSHPTGAEGSIEGTSVVFRRKRKTKGFTLAWPDHESFPRVEIIYSYAGADGAQIQSAVAAGVSGLVVAGLAPGYATPDQRRELTSARASGVQVVMSSRAAAGPTPALLQNEIEGLVGAQNLNPQKARILLAGAIMNGASTVEIERYFAEYS